MRPSTLSNTLWSVVPHGNGGKMALPVPCVAGKHFVLFLWIIHLIGNRISYMIPS